MRSNVPARQRNFGAHIFTVMARLFEMRMECFAMEDVAELEDNGIAWSRATGSIHDDVEGGIRSGFGVIKLAESDRHLVADH